MHSSDDEARCSCGWTLISTTEVKSQWNTTLLVLYTSFLSRSRDRRLDAGAMRCSSDSIRRLASPRSIGSVSCSGGAFVRSGQNLVKDSLSLVGRGAYSSSTEPLIKHCTTSLTSALDLACCRANLKNRNWLSGSTLCRQPLFLTEPNI